MTSDSVLWDPSVGNYNQDEEQLRIDEMQDIVKPTRNRKIHTTNSHLHPVELPDMKIIRNFDSTFHFCSATHRRKGTVSADEIAKCWGIGIEAAKRTYTATTQLGIRDFVNSKGTKRLKHTAYQLKHRRLRSSVYTNMMFLETKSLSHNNCTQVFSTDFNLVAFYPLRKKSNAYQALEQSVFDYGIFHTIIPDNANELTEGEFKKSAQKFGSQICRIEAFTPNQNKAEATICELKRSFRRAMRRTNAPAVLWDHCLQLMAEIRRHTALDIFSLNGETLQTMVTGETAHISHLVEHSWYDFVWYSNPGGEGPSLGRWLGPSNTAGQAMCSKIITNKGKVIHHSSVWPIDDIDDDRYNKCFADFNFSLKASIGAHLMNGLPPDDDDGDEFNINTPACEPYEDDQTPKQDTPEVEDYQGVLQDTGETGEGRIESNDNPADSIDKIKTLSGDDAQMHAVNISNDIIKDGVSNTQNQQRLINSK